MDQKREKIYIGIIIALLIFTYYSRSTQSGDLQRIENSINSMKRDVSHEVNRIQNQIGQMQEEERWWSRGAIGFDMKGEDLQEVTAEYRIRDYRDGETVNFHYLLPEQEEYLQVEMEEISTGVFRAVFDIELIIEPEIRVNYSGSAPTDRINEVEEWVTQEERQKDYLRHYVSTEYNGERRTTGEELMHFSGIKYEAFHPIQVNLHYRRGDHSDYNINVHVRNYDLTPKYRLEDIQVFLMMEGQQVKELEIEEQGEHLDRSYHRNIPVDEEEYDEILLRFTYDNGEVFERSLEIRN